MDSVKMRYSLNNELVFVVDAKGNPLMPTERLGWVRRMLKSGEAKVYTHDPHFTIQLLNENHSNYIQKITMGMDSGYTVGISGNANGVEIICDEIKLRSGSIKENLLNRASKRRNRRYRLRYRKGKFNITKKDNKSDNINKKLDNNKNKKDFADKWFPSTNKHFSGSHKKIIEVYNRILPINNSNWIIEVGKFDIQKMKNPEIEGVGYQQGDMYGYSETRAYVFDRDKYQCQNPNCPHKQNHDYPSLNIHHIVFRSNGGTDCPSNLITICSDCHTAENHKNGFLAKWDKEQRKMGVPDHYDKINSMHVNREMFYDLNRHNPNDQFTFTYGSITNFKRKVLGLEKSHVNDARAIAYPNEFIKKIAKHKNGVELQSDFQVIKPVDYLDNIYPIIQTNSKETGRRCLETFTDAKYLTIDGKVKSGNETAKEKYHKRLIVNNRLNRVSKVSKGKTVYNTRKSKYPKNTIVSAIIDNKKVYVVSGGVTNTNIYTLNNDKRFLAEKKYKLAPVAYRKGIIKDYQTIYTQKKNDQRAEEERLKLIEKQKNNENNIANVNN